MRLVYVGYRTLYADWSSSDVGGGGNGFLGIGPTVKILLDINEVLTALSSSSSSHEGNNSELVSQSVEGVESLAGIRIRGINSFGFPPRT